MSCFLLIAAVTLIIRFPFFFPEVDLDESTFILMGQEILDGYLPYDRLWDLKPPLLFGFFAALISIFGKTIPAVRLGGAFCAIAAAWLVYLSAEKIWNRRAGLIAAMLLTIFTALSIDGGSTTSEMIAIVPLMGAVILSLKGDLRTRDFFLIGLLISTACMFRLNLVYLALLGNLFLLPRRLVQSSARPIIRISAYALGGAVPVVLSLLPYLITRKEELFFTAFFRAPLQYAESQLTMVQELSLYLERFGELPYLFLNSFILISFCGGLIYIGFAWKNFSKELQRQVLILFFFIFATGVSILKTGEAYEHYLIQVLPFASLIAAFFIDILIRSKAKPVILLACAVWLVVPAERIITAYTPVISRYAAGQPLTYGPGYDIYGYLKKVNPENKPVYLMEASIVYWFNDSKPLTRLSTHPPNVGKEYLATVASGSEATVKSELAEVLEKKPAFIIKPIIVRYLRNHHDARVFLLEALATDYVLVHTIGEYEIYERF
ncbi:MAG: ArnT family glycosyltransferase [Syntrophobacteraceae bacterium]